MEIITRAEAKSQGLTQYFTGKPCKHGHLSPKLVSNYTCMECASARSKDYYLNNIEKVKEYQQRYNLDNSDKVAKRKKIYAAENADQIIKYQKEYREKNADEIRLSKQTYYRQTRELQLERSKAWRENNRALYNETSKFHCAKRNAAKLNRTPKWADLEAIKEFYKNCPEGYQVDHIIPLQGETVSGLHVLSNLQYLTPSQNASKGNTFDPNLYPEQQVTV